MKDNHPKRSALQKARERRKQLAAAQKRFKQAMRTNGFERVSVYLPADSVIRAEAAAKERHVSIDAFLRETYLRGEQMVGPTPSHPSPGKKLTAPQRHQREYEILRSSSVEEIRAERGKCWARVAHLKTRLPIGHELRPEGQGKRGPDRASRGPKLIKTGEELRQRENDARDSALEGLKYWRSEENKLLNALTKLGIHFAGRSLSRNVPYCRKKEALKA